MIALAKLDVEIFYQIYKCMFSSADGCTTDLAG